MTLIFTHRGLEPTKENFFSESSLEAFSDHLKRGFSLEADLNFIKDGIVICHDASLERLTKGKNLQELKNLNVKEACELKLPNGRLGSFEELMTSLRQHPSQILSLHFKGAYQNHICCDTFVAHMKLFPDLIDQVIVFDLSINAAKYIKLRMPELHLAGSVSHPYDIERFQNAVKGTLIPLNKFINNRHLFTWAWLDEWDLSDKKEDGSIDPRGKKLYTSTVFDILRTGGFKIALVSPELHATSPGLLGGERHPNASTRDRLFERIKEILDLQPDAICTDYPEEVKTLISSHSSKALA